MLETSVIIDGPIILCVCTWLHVHFCHRCLWCRYDVLLTANASVSNYWITVQPQYRLGSPNGFGVLRYEGAAPTLPQGPVPQPGTAQPWSISQIDEVTSSAYIVPCFLFFPLFYHHICHNNRLQRRPARQVKAANANRVVLHHVNMQG